MDALLFVHEVEQLFVPAIYKTSIRRYRNRFDWRNGISYSFGLETVKGASRNANGRTSASEQLIDGVTTPKVAPVPGLNEWKCMGLAPH
jgi:hypothetical protein